MFWNCGCTIKGYPWFNFKEWQNSLEYSIRNQVNLGWFSSGFHWISSTSHHLLVPVLLDLQDHHLCHPHSSHYPSSYLRSGAETRKGWKGYIQICLQQRRIKFIHIWFLGLLISDIVQIKSSMVFVCLRNRKPSCHQVVVRRYPKFTKNLLVA